MFDKGSDAYTRKNKRKFKLRIADLVRPHWSALLLALIAVLGETVTDVLSPWPIKVVVDNVLQSKKLPNWLASVPAARR